MKHISRFLLCALSLVCANTAIAAPVATTVGSNLTAYNPTSGATNNAMWNAYMNPRANTSAPTADFGNCNAAIIRCAQPKCSNGGCATMDVARPIVVGCVETNPSCKQYGDDLIDYIAAQLVSDANAASAAAAGPVFSCGTGKTRIASGKRCCYNKTDGMRPRFLGQRCVFCDKERCINGKRARERA